MAKNENGIPYFENKFSGRIEKCAIDVLEFDKDFDVDHENAQNLTNVIYNALAMSGEAGEVANVAKKMWRDGISEKLKSRLGEECVDVVIYMVKLLEAAGIDFDKAWEEKHVELYDRWNHKMTHERQSHLGS